MVCRVVVLLVFFTSSLGANVAGQFGSVSVSDYHYDTVTTTTFFDSAIFVKTTCDQNIPGTVLDAKRRKAYISAQYAICSTCSQSGRTTTLAGEVKVWVSSLSTNCSTGSWSYRCELCILFWCGAFVRNNFAREAEGHTNRRFLLCHTFRRLVWLPLFPLGLLWCTGLWVFIDSRYEGFESSSWWFMGWHNPSPTRVCHSSSGWSSYPNKHIILASQHMVPSCASVTHLSFVGSHCRLRGLCNQRVPFCRSFVFLLESQDVSPFLLIDLIFVQLSWYPCTVCSSSAKHSWERHLYCFLDYSYTRWW